MAQIIPIPSTQRQLTESAMPSGTAWGPLRPSDQDEGVHAADVLGLLKRHWMLILSIVTLSVGAAYLITRMTTPVYRASTTLYFADRQGSIPALDILNQIENGNNEVATEMEVMRSRALAEVVVDSLGLQVQVIDPPGSATSSRFRLLRANPFTQKNRFRFAPLRNGLFEVKNSDSGTLVATAHPGDTLAFGGVTGVLASQPPASASFELLVRSRADAVDALLGSITVTRPNRNASVVQVAYTGEDRAQTQAVPDVLAKSYLAWRSSLRKSGDRSTVEFLRRQIDTISVQLYAAEESLRRFREQNQVVDLPTQAQTQVQRLAALEAQRNDIDMQRASLKNLMADVKTSSVDSSLSSRYRRLLAFPGLMTTGNPAFPLLQNLADLEQRRSDLLVRRTPNDPDVQSVSQAISHVEDQIASVVETYVKGLDEQATSIASSLSAFHSRVDQVPRREVEYARLDRTTSGLTQIYTMLQTRLREAQIAEAVDDDAVRVVDPAALPNKPIAPRQSVNLVVGAFVGLLLAFVVVFLRERLDQTVHTKEEVELVSRGAVLALIPHIGKAERAKYFERWVRTRRNGQLHGNGTAKRPGESEHRLLLKDTQSVASEAFRKLRTNITFARPESPPKVLVFTSPAPGDGKSTSVMNLAIALVQQGKRVMVVDGDMRRGGLHDLLRGAQTPGLSEILVGQAEIAVCVQSLVLESFGTVDLIATGIVPPNPAELLASPRFPTLIESLRANYDAILIDSPPINLVTDAAIIGRETDGAVVVARAAKTTRGELSHAVDQLRQVQVPLTGLILNDYSAKRDSGYNASAYYGYSYEYKPYGGSG